MYEGSPGWSDRDLAERGGHGRRRPAAAAPCSPAPRTRLFLSPLSPYQVDLGKATKPDSLTIIHRIKPAQNRLVSACSVRRTHTLLGCAYARAVSFSDEMSPARTPPRPLVQRSLVLELPAPEPRAPLRAVHTPRNVRRGTLASHRYRSETTRYGDPDLVAADGKIELALSSGPKALPNISAPRTRLIFAAPRTRLISSSPYHVDLSFPYQVDLGTSDQA